MATTRVHMQPVPPTTLMKPNELLRIAIAGAVVGFVAFGLYKLLDLYVFTPLLCGGEAALLERCANKPAFSEALAMILAAIGALFVTVKLGVYRPLLVVIVTTAALWGVLSILSTEIVWWGGLLLAALFFGLAYALFSWLVQVRNLLLSFVISIVIIFAVRLTLFY